MFRILVMVKNGSSPLGQMGLSPVAFAVCDSSPIRTVSDHLNNWSNRVNVSKCVYYMVEFAVNYTQTGIAQMNILSC